MRLRIAGSPRDYILAGRSQDHYADLFAAIARDLGTHVPKNRRSPPERSPDPRLRPVLTQPVSSDILYGYGDPWVLQAEDHYFLAATSNDAPQSFPILSSEDLEAWRLESFAFPRGKKPEWAADGLGASDYWAPEIHGVGGRYVLCYSARERTDGSLAIGLATAKHPAGPYRALPEPLIRGGVIDAHIFVEASGEAYLLWKEDNNGRWPALLCRLLHNAPELGAHLFESDEGKRTAALYAGLWSWIATLPTMERFFALQPLIEAAVADYAGVQRRLPSYPGIEATQVEAIVGAMRTPVHGCRLDPDRLELTGDPFRVIENDLQWEGPLIEGMCLTRVGDRYFLFYSGNDFSTADYGIGYAVAKDVRGPWRKQREPLLKSTSDWWGPGHPSVAPGPDGSPMLFLHAYPAGRAAYNSFRALLAARLEFDGETVSVR